MKPLISVILPVFNVAPWLARCLDSVLCQTYRHLEVILVDDGSTDDSPDICDEYAKQDERIRVIHKINGGVSSARNRGLDEAKGEYISFVDSDDIIEPDMIERMLNNATKYNTPITCCLLDVVEIDGTVRHLTKGSAGVESSHEVISKYFNDQFTKDQMYGPCNKLINVNLLQGHRFGPYKLGEDILFMFELLTHAENVYYDDVVGYHYMHREGSAMTSSFAPKRLDYVYAARELEKLCAELAPYALPQAQSWVYRHVLGTVRQIYWNNVVSDYMDFVNTEKSYLRSNKHLLVSLGRMRKLDYLGVMFCPLYFKLLKLFK